MNILVVDDSKAMRTIVVRHLRQAGFDGHTFLEAANGVEAYTKIKEAPPDLVLCDWNMPEMNGIDLLEKLRTEGPWVKFGFVTSESTIEMKQRATENGALFLIGKPFTVETFQKTLQEFIT